MQVIVQLRVCRWEVGFVANVGVSAAPEAQFGEVGEFVGAKCIGISSQNVAPFEKNKTAKNKPSMQIVPNQSGYLHLNSMRM